MMEHQKLGGTRQSSPLEDEMTYPLTNDEYLTLKENLALDKYSNWESFLLSTLITTVISGFVIYFTGSIYKLESSTGQIIDTPQVITLIIYGAISFGCLLAFVISINTKKRSRSSIDRLNTRITKHLSNS
jgi:hypothetical protein